MDSPPGVMRSSVRSDGVWRARIPAPSASSAASTAAVSVPACCATNEADAAEIERHQRLEQVVAMHHARGGATRRTRRRSRPTARPGNGSGRPARSASREQPARGSRAEDLLQDRTRDRARRARNDSAIAADVDGAGPLRPARSRCRIVGHRLGALAAEPEGPVQLEAREQGADHLLQRLREAAGAAAQRRSAARAEMGLADAEAARHRRARSHRSMPKRAKSLSHICSCEAMGGEAPRAAELAASGSSKPQP